MSHAILHIDASASGAASVSRAATAAVVATLGAAAVTYRDLSRTPLPQITPEWVSARLTPADAQTPAEAECLALSDRLVAELQEADTIVIGLPVYNFGMPAALKAWVDLVARPKVTFAYTPEGPKGLLSGKRAIIVMASGGTTQGSTGDFASPHLTHVLRFLGVTDVSIVTAGDVLEEAA